MNIPQGCDEWFRWISRLQVFQESTRSDRRPCVSKELSAIASQMRNSASSPVDTGVLADFV